MKNKKTKLLLILLAIVLIIAGVVWYNGSLSGNFDVSASMPSNEMMLHIIQHADTLFEQDERFVQTSDNITDPSFTFLGGDYLLHFTCSEGSIKDLTNPNVKPLMPATGRYERQPLSDFWDFATPWSKCSVSISLMYDHFSFILIGSDLDAPSTAQLDEVMGIIEGIIGTP